MTSTTTLIKAYLGEDAARRAVEALLATGVPEGDIRRLSGRRLHDSRREPVGGWAGPVGPSDSVGTYGSRPVLRRRGTGTYAGDADRQRQGSYGDADRVAIVTHKDGAEHTRVTGHRGVRKLLRRAALDADAIDRTVDALAVGQQVVLVDVPRVTAADTAAELEHLPRAA